MIKIFKSLLILPIFIIQLAFAQLNNIEFRASWVITWDHIYSNADPGQNIAKIIQIMDDHKAANMNAVIFQVRQSGTAYYESSYEPWGYYSGYQYPGYDPLEIAIIEAHKRGLELHAWFNVFQTSSTYPGSPAAEHPEWICRDRDGIPMTSYRSISPGLQEVRDYTIDVAMEIVRNYDIDGLHLDYVRWNEHTNTGRQSSEPQTEIRRMDGIISIEEQNNLTLNPSGRYLYDYLHPYSGGIPDGYTSWEEWWRESVTSFVEALHDSIQSVKPYVQLSAAVLGKYNWSGWQGYGTVFQDGAKWFNEGSLDHIMPMSYHWTTADGFTGMLEDDCPQCWWLFVQPGVESDRPFTVGPGSYVLDENNVWYRHTDIVNAVRSLNWVKGFQFFSYGTWEDNDYFETAGDSFFENKTKSPPKPNNNSVTIEPPSLTINPLDNVSMELTIYPSSTLNLGWLILYRSLNPAATIDNGEIISIQYGSEAVKFVDILADSGLVYQYFATQTDRFWHESTPSNKVYSTLTPLPNTYIISNNYPNPFNGKTSIPFSIPSYGNVGLYITDLKGKIVATLVNQLMIPGDYIVDWHGKNDKGVQQASGIYLVFLKTNDKFRKAKRLVYLK
jgi:uncharacterized lipoprotein YddW (UPF0748 family)